MSSETFVIVEKLHELLFSIHIILYIAILCKLKTGCLADFGYSTIAVDLIRSVRHGFELI